ncbi:MAG: hypothetical protein AAGD96_20645 [Chloroflexota bacterium]
MKLNIVSRNTLWMVAISGALLIILFFISMNPAENGMSNGVIHFGPEPAFAGGEAVNALNEAGIAAYINIGESIDFSDLEGTFEIVEDQTADYIIGSISLPNYGDQQGEIFHTHAYVNTSGWIMVYFMDSSPASKIVDWKSYFNSGDGSVNTLLEIGLDQIASDIGVGADNPIFYDFGNPSATHMMIVAELTSYGSYDTFTINLPSDNDYKEISWGIYEPSGCCGGFLNVAGQTMPGSNPGAGNIAFGFVGDLSPNNDHLIEMDMPGGLVIVYREQ